MPRSLLFLVAILAGACGSAPTAGTGDVAFRLLWKGRSDLDLHVFDPYGEHLSFGNPEAASGGRLDVDCNGSTELLCRRPIENVFWPRGGAPEGKYRFWVRGYAIVPDESPVEARLFVLEGDRVVAESTGVFTENGEVLGPFELTYTPGLGTGPLQEATFSEHWDSVWYRCEDGFRFSLAVRFEWVLVMIDGQAIRLGTQPGSRGGHASTDGSVLMEWPEAGPATLVVAGVRHEECVPDPPRSPRTL